MRIALLGSGRIGRLHGRLVAAQAGVDEVVVHDVDPQRAADAALEFGGRVVANVENALRQVDAVVIAASTTAHAGLVRQGVRAGLPVFVEKPLAFDLDETIDIVREVEAAGAVVQVGFQRRFDHGYAEARRLVETGAMGTVYLARLIAHDNEPPPDAYIPTSGGIFRDSSIHDFDILRWVTGQDVVEVYAVGSVRGFPIFEKYDDVDTVGAILTLADGTLGVLSQTRHDPRGYDIRMEVIGSRDSIAVGLEQGTPIRSVEVGGPALTGPAWSSFLTRFEAAYRAELLAFLEVARGERPSPCTARDALEAMRVSIAATTSRLEHRPVELAEVPTA